MCPSRHNHISHQASQTCPLGSESSKGKKQINVYVHVDRKQTFTVIYYIESHSLWLCIDFREVNKKTLPDRQPIPIVQDIMDGLAGNL